jgi:uncharacterized membrane protein
MPDDAYRPPTSSVTHAAAARPFTGEPGNLDVGRAISEGWQAMLDNFPLWLGVGVVATLLILVSALTVIGIFLLVPVLLWGSIRALLAMFDRRGEFGQIFSGFSDYGSSLVSVLGIFLGSIVIGLPGQAAGTAGQLSGDPTLAALGSLLNIAWSLAILPLSFAIYFVVDQGMGVIEAYRTAWQCTRSQWLKILLLFLANLAIFILGLLALVIGVIPATAVSAFMWTSAYRQLTRTQVIARSE